jgi:hypothetical protein
MSAPQPVTPPRYDPAAAHKLSADLRAWARKLDEHVQARAGLRRGLLESWAGRNRTEFDEQFHRQQSAIRDLAGQSRHLATRVDEATRKAEAERQLYPDRAAHGR